MYDNLNRMSASPGATYTNDLSGNRLTKTVGANSATNTWDSLNRLTKYLMGNVRVTYNYRPDGLLHRKIMKGSTTSGGSGYGDFNFQEDNPTYFNRYAPLGRGRLHRCSLKRRLQNLAQSGQRWRNKRTGVARKADTLPRDVFGQFLWGLTRPA